MSCFMKINFEEFYFTCLCWCIDRFSLYLICYRCEKCQRLGGIESLQVCAKNFTKLQEDYYIEYAMHDLSAMAVAIVFPLVGVTIFIILCVLLILFALHLRFFDYFQHSVFFGICLVYQHLHSQRPWILFIFSLMLFMITVQEIIKLPAVRTRMKLLHCTSDLSFHHFIYI